MNWTPGSIVFERFIEDYCVAWDYLEQDCVSVQSAPGLPAERRGFRDALFVHFEPSRTRFRSTVTPALALADQPR